MRMDADGLRLLAKLVQGLKIEINVRSEPVGIAANDRKHQRKSIFCRADHRLRTSTDTDPSFQMSGIKRWKCTLIYQGRPRRAPPIYRFLFDQLRKEIEFLFEQPVILTEFVSEQWKRLREGASPENDLGAPAGCGIKRRKSLKHADWIIRTEHSNSRAQSYAFRSPCNRGKYYFWRRYSEISTMMLAESDEIDAEFVSQDCFVDHVADNLGVGLGHPILAECDITECVETEFENIVHRFLFFFAVQIRVLTGSIKA